MTPALWSDPAAGPAYATVQILADAIHRANSLDPTAIRVDESAPVRLAGITPFSSPRVFGSIQSTLPGMSRTGKCTILGTHPTSSRVSTPSPNGDSFNAPRNPFRTNVPFPGIVNSCS